MLRAAASGALLLALGFAAAPAMAQDMSAGGGAGAGVSAASGSSSFGRESPGAFPGLPSSPDRPDVRVSGFIAAPFAEGALPPRGPSGATRAYEIQPSLTFGAVGTDNTGLSTTNRRGELALSVSPGLSVRADSVRLRGSFFFAPSFTYYANDSQPNRVTSNFLGTGTVEVIPGRFFVDVRGAAFLQPVVPGATAATTLGNTRSPALQQNVFAAISPYYVQRFGSLATGIIGYQLQYNTVQGSSVFLQPDGTTLRNSPGGTVGQNAYAAIRSGEDFGRLTMEGRINAQFFSGGGSINNGSQNIIASFDTRYAVTRTVFLLGEIGWQDVRFGGVPGFRYDGLIWAGGARWDPSPNSTLIAALRSRAGFTSPLVDARFSIGPRTVAFGRYLEDVGNAISQTANLLNSISVDAAGNPVDSATGAPLPQIGGSGFVATAGGVSRNRVGVASVTRFLARDSISVQYLYSQRIPLSAAVGQVPFAQTNNTVSLAWQRQFSDLTRGFASAGYTWTRTTLVNLPSESFVASMGVSHQISRRLFGNLIYQFTQRTQGQITAFGTTLNADATQNTVIGNLSVRF